MIIRAGGESNITEIDLYVDVLFFINFTMDILVLSITGKVMKYRRSLLRYIAAGSLGAIWAVLTAAFPYMPLWLEIPMTYGAVSTLMTVIAFRLRKPKEILRTVAALYLVTVMLAGTMEALYQHTKAGYYIEQILSGNNRKAIPFYRLLLLAAAAYFGIRYVTLWILKVHRGRNHFYQVTMHYRGKEKTVEALLDTGNRLYEPVTHKPVHVVTYGALKDICDSVSSVVYIPFGSVGKASGILPGIYLDEMEIRQGSEVKQVVKPLVAVVKQPLSADGQYEMLLHEEFSQMT
jgi:stage II sporulation protein GA (sporulation sigma-E factor processing peptidase)